MTGLQIGNEFLDLPPATVVELVKANPFLQFDDALIGEYSYPFSVKCNEKNLRLLSYAGVPQQVIENTGIDARIYDNGIQVGYGKIKIEKGSLNLNKTSRGTINCYFLSGVSDFFQGVRDKKLRQIDMGGIRSFDWDGLTTISGTGFWRHIHQVANGNVNDYDYAFFPVVNKGWVEGDVYPPVMNMMYYDSGEALPIRFPTTYVPLDVRERNRIVPFPYLKNVLQAAFSYVGWTLTGDILNDADFEKITMINFRAIDWCHVTVSGGVATSVPRDPVEFNLQNHLPDISIPSFLIGLKNRMGLWYDFDNTSRKAVIKKVQSLTTGQPTDMTAFASPLINKNIIQDKPIYALRNNFLTDLGGGAPDFKVVLLQGDLDKVSDLPAAAEALYGHVYRIIEENNYYVCHQDDSEDWIWELFAYNIYDYEPTGTNAEIKTDATLVGNEYYSPYLDFIPRIDNQGEWNGRTDASSSWGIHLCFFFGKRNNKSGDPVPFASHHIYDSNGYALAAWSLAFKGKKTDDTEIGLYDLNWKDFLDMISGAEEVEFTLSLPMHKYLQLKFSDRIVIAGVLLFIKEVKSQIPYRGSVQCTAIRV